MSLGPCPEINDSRSCTGVGSEILESDVREYAALYGQCSVCDSRTKTVYIDYVTREVLENGDRSTKSTIQDAKADTVDLVQRLWSAGEFI